MHSLAAPSDQMLINNMHVDTGTICTHLRLVVVDFWKGGAALCAILIASVLFFSPTTTESCSCNGFYIPNSLAKPVRSACYTTKWNKA